MAELDLSFEDIADDDPRAGKKMRDRFEEYQKQQKQILADLRKDNEDLKAEAVFNDEALKGLNSAQRKAVIHLVEGEKTAETIKAAATSLGFIAASSAPTSGEQAAQQQAQAVGVSAGAAPGASSVTITPAEFLTWGVDRMMAAREKNPNAVESLKRGESVPLASFS